MTDAKGLYMEYKTLSEQLQQVQKFLEQTTENVAEVNNLIESLEEFSKLQEGTRVLAPIASGIFIDTTLNDATHVRMNVGSSTVTAKTVAEAQDVLRQQLHDLESVRDRAEADQAAMLQRLRVIEEQVQGGE